MMFLPVFCILHVLQWILMCNQLYATYFVLINVMSLEESTLGDKDANYSNNEMGFDV